MTQRVAVMGLGLMGAGMAGRLIEQGFEVTVWNRSAAKAEPLRARGAHVAATPADAAAGADIVIAMLADDEASRGAWLGEAGALGAMRKDAIAIDASTLTIDWVRELARAADAAGIAFLDAPVTGSRGNAEAGTLRFLVGGDAATVARARPAFDAMGNALVAMGAVGNGALVKLINNFMSAVQSASLAEALAMAERSGLDMAAVGQVIGDGAPGSPIVKTMMPRMLARDYRANFVPGLMVKDLDYAIRTFAGAGIDLASARAARARYADAARVNPGLNIASVIEPLRDT